MVDTPYDWATESQHYCCACGEDEHDGSDCPLWYVDDRWQALGGFLLVASPVVIAVAWVARIIWL